MIITPTREAHSVVQLDCHGRPSSHIKVLAIWFYFFTRRTKEDGWKINNCVTLDLKELCGDSR